MKKIILSIAALLVLSSVSFVQASVGVSRSSITAAGTRPTTWSISWRLYGPTGEIPPYTSVGAGVFLNGVDLLGAAPSLSTRVTYNATTNRMEGRATEALTIPADVLRRAENAGLRQIEFMRFFSGIPEQGNGTYITISLTSVAGGELSISRMRLYFENQRGEITVNRNEKGLKTFADINYTGKGLFKGYWQVDNRVISYVNKHLVYGKKLTIETPDIPDLPTFTEGTHEVKFVIQSPDLQGFTMPKAIYYVRPFAAIQIIPIVQKDPYNMAPVDYSPLTLTWDEEDDLVTYLVEFMDVYNQDPMFSAYTKNPEYTMPPYVLKHYFKERKRYYWKVKGFNSEDNIAGESPTREFRFKAE